MRQRMLRFTAFVLCLAAGTLTACSGDNTTGVSKVRPAGPSRTIYYGDGDCPPEATSCEPLSAAERDTIYWDIQRMIKWDWEDCAITGYRMQDLARYGDVRKFTAPLMNNRITWGYWEPAGWNYPYSPEQISFNTQAFAQGWASERGLTAMHEARHAVLGGGDEPSTEGFADNCINW